MATACLPDPKPAHLRPSAFSHLVLQSPRFRDMVAWYKKALLAEPLFENDLVCFLTYDDEHHRIMIGSNPNASPRDPRAAGVVHWAYSFEKLDHLVDTYERLRDDGIIPHSCINHGFTTSLYYHDPDGNEVELAVDNFESRDAMNAWFATGAFDRNFVGCPFDPEYLVKRHREGAADADIFQETYR
jgi:catechol-2,3-dioxygenase